jgi:3',5'-cyclic AMP phosphodiesterase CpdA
MQNETEIAFAVNTGDLSFDSREEDFLDYKKLSDMLPFPMLDVLGNHDVFKNGRNYFAKYCGTSDFTFTYGSAYFLFLDNASGKFDEGQIDWLRQKLMDAQKYPYTIVVAHRPPFNPHYDPEEPLDFKNFREHTGWWDFGEAFQKLYEEFGVDLVIAGHFHYFSDTELNGVRYLVTGGGGIIITEGEGGFHHYLLITVSPAGITYELKKVEPPAWQYAFYYFWKNCIYRITSSFQPAKNRLPIPYESYKP